MMDSADSDGELVPENIPGLSDDALDVLDDVLEAFCLVLNGVRGSMLSAGNSIAKFSRKLIISSAYPWAWSATRFLERPLDKVDALSYDLFPRLISLEMSRDVLLGGYQTCKLMRREVPPHFFSVRWLVDVPQTYMSMVESDVFSDTPLTRNGVSCYSRYRLWSILKMHAG
ncbi:hypothetical protein Tco_0775264, partial [Tanacetum coccineum]